MAEIIRTYRQEVGATRFIGKRYTNSDRDAHGMFGGKWGEWHEKGWFGLLDSQSGGFGVTREEGDACIGLIREEDEDFDRFEYWIGCFAPEGTAVPDGFEHVDFPRGALGVCWLHGHEDALYGREAQCLDRLVAEGFQVVSDWCFERYVPSRVDAPDGEGKVVLDICFFVK